MARMALGAPLGVVLDSSGAWPRWAADHAAWARASLAWPAASAPVPVIPGEHLPFRHVLGRVAPHGMGLALGGVGYSVLATFVTLFYASRHWSGAALVPDRVWRGVHCGAAAVYPDHQPVRRVSGGAWSACPWSRWECCCCGGRLRRGWRLAAAALAGFGFSLVFPALGVEAVKRVPEHNRGTALGVYTAFADVSFFLVGPLAGAVIGVFGYASAFLFALVCVLAALGIVVALALRRARATG